MKSKSNYPTRIRQLLLSIISVALCIGKPAMAASPAGDVVGKVTVGYQGWFGAIGDGSPQNVWWHWSANWAQAPSPNNNSIKAWPDVTGYTTTYQTAYANLNNGNAAKLFSSYDQSTVNAQFQWMQQNSIDTAALQRFNPAGEANRNGMATRVMNAAQTYGRKFFIMYDITGWETMDADLKTDWVNEMINTLHVTSSSAYAKQNGKPVVCIWLATSDRPVSELLDIVTWFEGQGCYVIGGVERGWRTDSAKISVYNAMNMIQPWLIGSIGSIADADNYYSGTMVADQSYCNSHGIDFQPIVLPGDLSARQRVHGNLMWEMFYNCVRVGCQGIYISMYDEFNEGNQITKTAPDTSWVPSNSGFLGLNEDGTWCSSDYYLRLTRDGGNMLKGIIGLTSTRPTNPAGDSGGGVVGPTNGVTYHLICQDSGKALDNGGSTTTGTTVNQWANQAGNINQEWKLTAMSGGYFNLVCSRSGMALDNSGSTTNGSNVKQWTVNVGNPNQNWTFVNVGGTYPWHLKCQTGGLSLDNRGSTTDGTAVGQWSDGGSGNPNQNWQLQFIR